MAIKERKQITGTTAQIQGYAGHEGQIVWDKEKKTFVGMSGTAGTNYPLAPQAYVDTQLTEVDTQLTEGLAGKEDKGTCLPLTGGLLSGHLNLDPNFGDGNINIGFNFEERLGGGVDFRSISSTISPGAFSIYAQNVTQLKTLEGRPDGTLLWGGKYITYITSVEYVEGSGFYIRYSDGIQICAYNSHSNLATTVISYPAPFLDVFASLADGVDAYSTDWNSTSITIRSRSGNSIGFFSYFAIGRWK